uniref:Uncharacterized protein n=1 Tax=Panagrolaimus sp. ES5 TaxID=591445 RepID=A0AC34G4H8_9BILA
MTKDAVWGAHNTFGRTSFNAPSSFGGSDDGRIAKPSDDNTEAKNSTLSLHIAAYEDAADTAGMEHKRPTTKAKRKQQFNGGKGWFKSLFAKASIGLPYEIPRQPQDHQQPQPEVMQFKASQRLLNPNTEAVQNVKTVSPQPPSYGINPYSWKTLAATALGHQNAFLGANVDEYLMTPEERLELQRTAYLHSGFGTFDSSRTPEPSTVSSSPPPSFTTTAADFSSNVNASSASETAQSFTAATEKAPDNCENEITSDFSNNSIITREIPFLPDVVTVPTTPGKHIQIFSTAGVANVKQAHKDNLEPWKGKPRYSNFII